MSPKTWIEISKEALKHNYQCLVALHNEVMPVIKANGYGHGLLLVAEALDEAGAKWFAVDSLEEALTVKRAGFKQNIHVLGCIPREALEDAIRNNISFTLFNFDQLDYLEARKGEGRAIIHLPTETGLYREGFELTEFQEILERVKSSAKIRIGGIQTHFANIEDTPSSDYADKQLNEYKKYLELTNEYNVDSYITHTAASAASILYPATYFDMIRPGLALYGLWPSEDVKQRTIKQYPDFILRPALTWKTIIATVKHVRAGERVGYGLTEMLERDSTIAVLPIGYYDGFDRVGMSSKGFVLIRGERAKVIGRVCMNMCMVDVTDIPEIRSGDEVVLIGSQGDEEISAEEVADRTGSINYEIVARLGEHIERRLI